MSFSRDILDIFLWGKKTQTYYQGFPCSDKNTYKWAYYLTRNNLELWNILLYVKYLHYKYFTSARRWNIKPKVPKGRFQKATKDTSTQTVLPPKCLRIFCWMKFNAICLFFCKSKFTYIFRWKEHHEVRLEDQQLPYLLYVLRVKIRDLQLVFMYNQTTFPLYNITTDMQLLSWISIWNHIYFSLAGSIRNFSFSLGLFGLNLKDFLDALSWWKCLYLHFQALHGECYWTFHSFHFHRKSAHCLFFSSMTGKEKIYFLVIYPFSLQICWTTFI